MNHDQVADEMLSEFRRKVREAAKEFMRVVSEHIKGKDMHDQEVMELHASICSAGIEELQNFMCFLFGTSLPHSLDLSQGQGRLKGVEEILRKVNDSVLERMREDAKKMTQFFPDVQ